MKAIVWTKYGSPDGLQLREVAKPVPKENEILIKVQATTVSMGDCELRSLKFPWYFRIPFRLFFGLRKPKNVILGQDLAGEVESIGKNVSTFKEGDQVVALLGFRFGAYAEYKSISETRDIVLKPSTMTFEEASTIPTWAATALHFLKKSLIQKDQKVLINGACGGIGVFAVQLAKCYGAEVTAVDSTEKLDVLTSLGANFVIDYTKEDFTRNGLQYDVIFDVVGKCSYSRSLKSVKPHGYLLLGNPKFSQILRGKWSSIISGKKVIANQPNDFKKYILEIKDLIEEGKIKSIIDRTYLLEQIPDAHRYVESGKKIGHVVIKIN